MRNQLRHQKAMEQQLNATIKEILAAAWERRQQESGRCGENKGGEEDSDSGGEG